MSARSEQWLVNKPLYRATHFWVARNFGKATKCEHEGITCSGKSITYQWANISGEYHRQRDDWKELCASCHKKLDYTEYCREVNSILKKGNEYAKRVPVTATTKDGRIFKSYKSMADAAKDTGIAMKAISNCVRGRTKTSGGLLWH